MSGHFSLSDLWIALKLDEMCWNSPADALKQLQGDTSVIASVTVQHEGMLCKNSGLFFRAVLRRPLRSWCFCRASFSNSTTENEKNASPFLYQDALKPPVEPESPTPLGTGCYALHTHTCSYTNMQMNVRVETNRFSWTHFVTQTLLVSCLNSIIVIYKPYLTHI